MTVSGAAGTSLRRESGAMLMLRLLSFLLVALPTIAIPPGAFGQATLELGPLVGSYVPARNFGPSDDGYTGLPIATSDLSAMAVGLDARVWLGWRAGLELQATEAKSNFGGGIGICIPPPGSCGVTPRNHATITTVAAQMMYRPAAGGPLRLSAGAGIVSRGGTAYGPIFNVVPFRGTTTVAGAVGADMDLPLGHRLVASVGITALAYALDVRDSLGQRYEHGTQIDLLPHVNLAWRWRMGGA